jgi:hypothetical protein
VSQWYLMSIALDLFCLIVSFKMPKAVELSVRSGVAGWMWPNSVRVTLRGVHFGRFENTLLLLIQPLRRPHFL